MNYIYDDVANIRGFLPAHDNIGSFSRSKLNGHKKYLTSNGNPKYQKAANERSVDSYFRVIKSSGFANSLIPAVNTHEEIRKIQKNTIPPNRNMDIAITETKSPSSKKFVKVRMSTVMPVSVKSTINTSEIKKLSTDGTYEGDHRQSNAKLYHHKIKDAVNTKVHQHEDGQRVVSRQNHRHRSSLLANRSQSFHHKLQSPSKFNKTIHRSLTNDKHVPNVRRIFNDKGNNLQDKIQQKTGRKRDTSANEDTDMFLDKNKYYTISDNLISMNRGPIDQAIIANIVDDNTEVTNSPYADFYRMSPDITDQQDGYMFLGSQNERINNLYKEREAAMNSENEMEKSQNNYKKFSNNIKMHKKVKNFSNFRNF
ncbi:unnamed protein product [Parnassius apollo]|uniref:(apollo) hypothetical protein n=1 Tax=Parnassius apollo TaxID=110799 RepID=A0A8S3Y359_PARAO|nr:unnamed protein product [Parnassius apollo]